MSAPALLDQALLDQFDARLRALGAAIVDAWAPGLTDDAIDALVGPIGITLPEEARTWWRWHNGLLPNAPPTAKRIVPRRELCSLETVTHGYEHVKDELLDAYGIVKMLQPFSDFPVIFLDCSGPRDAPVPIHSLNDWVEEPRLVLPSFGELIAKWIEYIYRGIYRTNADGTWAWNDENVPRDVVNLGVY